MFYVYVIKNQLNDKIYIGQTVDREKRLKRHNLELPAKTKSYTYKNRGRWKLIYQEIFNTREEAIIREKELKSFRGREFVRTKTLGP